MMHSTTWAKQNKPLRTRLWVMGLWLLLWQGAYFVVRQPLLLPAPLMVARRLWALAGTVAFWAALWHSLGRILAGFFLGLALGTILAAGTAFCRPFYAFVELPMGVVKATPVASFVILALVWISGRNLSIFISFLMVLPLVWQNVHEGITQTDPQLLEMARVFRLSRWDVARAIYLPQVLPYFLTAVRVSLGFAWKSGVAGEVLAIPSGSVGAQLYSAKVYLETVDLFAWTAVIILLSMVIEKGAVALLGWVARRTNRAVGKGERP